MSKKYIFALGIICFLFVPQIGIADPECRFADLRIEAAETPDPVNAGDVLTYAVTASNHGPQTALQVHMIVVIPESLALGSLPPGCTESAGVINCDLGTLGEDSALHFDFFATVDPALSGYISAAFTVQSLEPGEIDPWPGNNTGNAETFVLGPTLAISINDVEISEPGDGTVDAIFTVALSQPSAYEVTVEYATADVTSTSGIDYLPAGGILTFPPQTVELPVNVAVLADAENTEGSETFVMNLTNPVSAILSDAQGIATIQDPCLFCDHFDDNIMRTDWTYAKGCWTEEGHALVGSPCTSCRRADAIASPAFAGAGPCTVEALMLTEGGPGNKVWLQAWYQNKKNTVEVLMKEQSDKWVIRQRAGGKVVGKTTVPYTIDPNVRYLVKLCADGSQIGFSVNGELLTQLVQNAPVEGTIGFKTKNTTARFCKIYVN